MRWLNQCHVASHFRLTNGWMLFRDSPEILQKLPAILQRHQFDTKIGRQLIKSTPSCGGGGNHHRRRRRRRHRHLSPGGDTIVRFPLPCGPLTWRGGKWRHLSASVCTGTDKPTKSFPVNLEVDLEVDFSCRNESRCRCRYFQQPNGSQ